MCGVREAGVGVGVSIVQIEVPTRPRCHGHTRGGAGQIDRQGNPMGAQGALVRGRGQNALEVHHRVVVGAQWRTQTPKHGGIARQDGCP